MNEVGCDIAIKKWHICLAKYLTGKDYWWVSKIVTLEFYT